MTARKNQNRTRQSVLVSLVFCACSLPVNVEVVADDPPAGEALTAKLGQMLLRENGDIFWAPASGFSAENSWSNIFGDEARSVFGPIPEISCSGKNGSSFHLEVDGLYVEQVGSEKEGYRFEHRSASGNVRKTTKAIDACDKPSLANTAGHACAAGSRVVVLNERSDRGVDWVALCRKSDRTRTLESSDSYWHPNNPDFALLGVIGFNPGSGEVVFIDGTNYRRGRSERSIFSWLDPYTPPGGLGYDDVDGRNKAYKLYTYARRIACENCHDNKEPWIITPHLKYRGFGYRDRTREDNLAVINVLPLVQPRPDISPYRVIGTRYTKRAKLASKTFRDPTGSCTYCHTLTTGWTGQVLAYDAVGKVNPDEPYKSVFEKVHDARTDWAKQGQNTHPWMVPWLGPNVKPNPETGWTPTEIEKKNWKRIEGCINETSKEDCHYKQVYTSCPAPESLKTDCSSEDELNNRCTRLADPFAPSEMMATTTAQDGELDQALPYDMKTTVTWSYLNGLGGVPQRDDVRFNLAIREVEIPDDGTAPTLDDYTSLHAGSDPYFADPKKSGDIHYCDLGILREETCHILQFGQGEFFINNISYAGHVRNTTPEPTYEPRQYSVVIPTQCNKRYLARLVPKRFCFDRSGVLTSNVDHVTYFDVTCAID